jgi:molybdate transport system substrate-binding protein
VKRHAFLLPVLLVLALLGGCGAGRQAGGTSGGGVHGSIRVFAAASLTGSFTALAKRFEHQHPGTTVQLSFGASSDLAEQIDNGAPADVFASASPTNMRQVVQAGNAEQPKQFASNTMEVAVPPANPGQVHRLADLARNGVKVALCQPQVPCGAVAREVLRNAGLTVHPVTEEVDVKSVLTKVTLGEVDAGVVYVTDVRAAGRQVTGVPIPAGVNASTQYPITVVRGSGNGATARAFERLVLSAQGRRVLAKAGFGGP